MKHPMDLYAPLFPSKTVFARAKKEFEKTGRYDAENDLWDCQYRSLDSRIPKAGFTKKTSVNSDWCYNETPPVIHWHEDGIHFLITQWNGPALSGFVFVRGKDKARAEMMRRKRSVIIIRKPTYEVRVDSALRIRKGS